MLPYKGFNDYFVEVYKGARLAGVLKAVTNLAFARLWLNLQFRYRGWTSIRVYHRDSGTFIGAYSKEGIFPAKPMI